MNIKKHTYIILSALAFTACSHDDNSAPTYTVGDADNAIVLSAGIAEGASGVSSRGAEDNHSEHTLFTSGTKALIRIDGEWHHESGDPITVSQTTTATIGAETVTDSKHNSLSMSPQLYWDDYGTADPANKEKGRTRGLDIYGVAVDGYKSGTTAALPAELNIANTSLAWQSLSWTLDTDPKTNDWKNKDLLISNNIKGDENRFTFANATAETKTNNILEFTHAMSKITFRLIAGEGFPTTEGVGNTEHRFASAPEVILTSNEGTSTTNAEWPNTACSVNIETGTVTSPTVPAKITMHTSKTDDSQYTVIYDALVVPGSCFGTTDAATIARINADGNIYYVTAAKIREKMFAINNSTNYKTESGKNYIFNITVNKTSIDVTATIKNWDNVSADNDEPIINFSKCYGHEGDNFAKAFSFYRSTSKDGSYLDTDNQASVTYADSKYTMSPQLYWPNHQTHYFFRGIWPTVVKTATDGHPLNTQVTANAIEVHNCTYEQDKYPSDLMIGLPRNADGTPDETCKAGHKEDDGTTPKAGICATDAATGLHDNEGLIHMNFRYAMSQVIVNLQTSSGPNAVAFNEYTSVHIIDGYTQGVIKLGLLESDFTGKEKASYPMTKEGDSHAKFHDAIIPQSLVNGDNPTLKFKITVGDGTQSDVYETVLGIKNIQVTEGGTKKSITAWEPGKKYTYTLTITKTDITVTATLTNWDEVTASEKVWF